MVVKTIKYVDFNGEERTEDFYFHLSKAEVAEMELIAGEGGLSGLIERAQQHDDRATIVKTFKYMIKKSVGYKSEDGRRFIKTEDYADEFEQTGAYSEMFIELLTHPELVEQFANQLVVSMDSSTPKQHLTTTPPMTMKVEQPKFIPSIGEAPYKIPEANGVPVKADGTVDVDALIALHQVGGK